MKRIAPARMARAAALLAMASIMIAACGSSATPAPATPAPATPAPATAAPATPAPATPAPATPAPVTPAPATPAPVTPAPKKLKVGYISLGESIPFVKLVSDDIKAQAEKAGVDLVFCDSAIDQAKALECAQNLKVQEVQAILNFQLFADSSKEICDAHGNLPTIAIDIQQKPCQVAFMGADNTFAGTVVGRSVGEQLKAENGCKYSAVLTLESKSVGEVNIARTGGMISGFEEVCGKIDPAKYRSLDVGGTTDSAVTMVGDSISSVEPGGVVVILSLNDDMGLGALAAARTVGRDKELRIGAQGADPSAWKEIACNPQWLADAAYFPERYGTILIPAVVDLLNGKTIPENLFTKHEAITRDNIRTVYPETPACN